MGSNCFRKMDPRMRPIHEQNATVNVFETTYDKQNPKRFLKQNTVGPQMHSKQNIKMHESKNAHEKQPKGSQAHWTKAMRPGTGLTLLDLRVNKF